MYKLIYNGYNILIGKEDGYFTRTEPPVKFTILLSPSKKKINYAIFFFLCLLTNSFFNPL